MLADRDKRRATYAALAADFDACITLTATGAAPVGLGSTGDPVFVVPASMLGVPAISLPRAPRRRAAARPAAHGLRRSRCRAVRDGGRGAARSRVRPCR